MSFGSGEPTVVHYPFALCGCLLVLLICGLTVSSFAKPGYAVAGREIGSNHPASYEMLFQGNAAMSERQLRRAAKEEIKAFDTAGRKRADIDDAAFQMQIAYRRAGYAFAEVDYQIEQAENLTRITFVISEGPRVVIKKITFSGNEALDQDTLLSFFERSRTGLIGRGELLFVRSDVMTAVDEIRRQYITQGYLDALVDTPRLEFSRDRSRVDISITVQEGVQYRIHSIDLDGDLVPDVADDLKRLREEMVGQPYFNRKRLILQTRLLEIYGNSGYPDAVVDVDRRPLTHPGQVVLDVSIESGPLVTISDIDIRGNERTSSNFIRKRIRQEPGERYNLALQKQSFRDLYRTGIFSKVDLWLEKLDVPERRVLVVVVQETPSKELYFEPGWGSYELLRLRLGFREKNLFGTGLSLGSEATGSLKARSLLGTLSDPFFLNTDIRADLNAFYSQRVEPSFTREDIGGSLSLTRDLTENIAATGVYTIRSTDISNVDDKDLEEDSGNNYDFASLKLQTTFDTRNDLFFPTAGQRVVVSAEQADELLGSGVNLTRLTAGARFFFRLTKNAVLGLRYTSGLIIPGRDQVTVPLAERFFNGGENTVRSFEEAELGPQGASKDPAGGYGFNVFNIEWRHRIIGNLIGSLFFDYGNISPNRTRQEQGKPPYANRSEVLSDTIDDFFQGFRPAVGFGVQYLLPVGPARLDFAFNPDRDSKRDEEFFVFHFSVGMAF